MDPSPRDNTDPAKDIARNLADIACQIATFKGKANAYLTDPNYDTLRLSACSSVSFASTLALVPAYQAGGVLGELLSRPTPCRSTSIATTALAFRAVIGEARIKMGVAV